MSVQPSTSETVNRLLNDYFNSLGEQNEGLANKINAFLTAKENKEATHRGMLIAIESLIEVKLPS